ncbi:hypothetical protein NE237_005234 [Protea cynaroides]|uniref:Tyrosine specific protein phosphatases domain-containing protein n=1 Tax=Protea cynaroides TaxID=273540 RepID=A0A9Q0QUC8_9MAGN|nr:hypothetical protein NE237_005234 [Protea cynaroides]
MGVGISVLIGLKATVLFCMFAYLRALGFILSSIPFLYASLVALLVSVASHSAINLPMLLGKRSDGSFPIWSIILFAPYLYFVRFFSFLRRMHSREPPYSEICEGVFVGGWPSSLDKLPPGEPAIIDCTSELPRIKALSQNAYLCVPTWDTRSPQPAEIESAVRWACRKRDLKKPIFIHCAYGHGRSVAVMCAFLVAIGVAEDWKNAEKIIRERRPCIRMNALHRKSLEEWSKHRILPKRNAGSGVSSVILSDASGSSKF